MISLAAAFVVSSIFSAGTKAYAGKRAKQGAFRLATRIEETGVRQAGLLTRYAEQQEEYAGRYDVYSQSAEDVITQNTEEQYKYGMSSAALEEKEIPLLQLKIERQVEDEKIATTDREIDRKRRLNSALASQVALRTAQGIQAYSGSAAVMMGADIKQFEYDQARDKADSARRIVDANFFGAERMTLMADRVSLLRQGADTERTAGMNQARLTAEQIDLQAESIRLSAQGTRASAASKLDASKLEAEATRIQGKQARTGAYISAANTLLGAAYDYKALKLGG
jgi:hypothetical protein